MQPINGYYLFELGGQLTPLTKLTWNNTTWASAHYPVLVAQGAIGALLNQSVYQLRTSRQDGVDLLAQLDNFAQQVPNDPARHHEIVPTFIVWPLIEKANQFLTVLRAELGVTPMFYVSPRHNADMAGYINFGHLCFPPELAGKVPEAIPDAQQAARCIAYDLPTAAGFHLHRANESVLRRYFDHVAGAENRPDTRNMGDYLNKLRDLKKGDKKVLAALRDLKDLHRNPLMHPEEHIASIDDAISLMGGVRQAMSLMLKELPEPNLFTSELAAALAFGRTPGADG